MKKSAPWRLDDFVFKTKDRRRYRTVEIQIFISILSYRGFVLIVLTLEMPTDSDASEGRVPKNQDTGYPQ